MGRSSKINVLISTIEGTGLPPTLCLALPPDTPISSLRDELDSRLPTSASPYSTRLLLTTLSSRWVPIDSPLPISHFLPTCDPVADSDSEVDQLQNDFLHLRLAVPLLGGKGGFGSQLRAAGGRMSKRNKRANVNPEEEQGSSRNLDGRRLRTVTEAKALAEYLAIKPEMEKREKEARRKRWQEIIEMTERKQEEIRNGKKGAILDGRWVEEKEVMGERTREAVMEAMKAGAWKDNIIALGEPSSSRAAASSSSADEAMEEDEESENGSSKATTPPSEPDPAADVKGKGKEKETAMNYPAPAAKKFFGFDDDDEFMSSDDESGNES